MFPAHVWHLFETARLISYRLRMSKLLKVITFKKLNTHKETNTQLTSYSKI